MAPPTLIDISAAFNQGAGIGRYCRELTRKLIPLLPPGSTRLWYAADDAPVDPRLLDRPPWNGVPATQAHLSRANVDRFFIRARFPVGRLLGAGNPSDSYSPDFTAPPGAREHVTIHDLAWMHPEAQSPPDLANFLAPVVDRAIGRATTIFTVSESVRAEILNRYGVGDERVIVAANAAAPPFFHADPLTEPGLVTLGIRSPFLLYVGTIEPRKNLPLLFEAMTRLPSELMLTVVGKRGWRAMEELAPIARFGLEDRVVLPGFVTEGQLAGLYASATAVVYPSRYEGFGLPIVEGLAAGTPVAASDLPVFHEVGGSEIAYFDPTDAPEMAFAIEQAVSSNSGAPDARERRRARARTFDWYTSAGVVSRRLQEVS